MFTPIETSIGAVLLHQATSLLLYQNGSVLGCAGILRRVLTAPTRENISFMAGMALSFLPLKLFLPELLTNYPPIPSTLQAALVTLGVGALVGWGTKASSGCTSGHMLCGLARLSGRSTVAVATFFPAAIVTHHLAHPTLFTEACPPGRPCYLPTYPSWETTNTLLLLATATIFAARTVPSYLAKIAANEPKTDSDSVARQAVQVCAGLEFGLGLHISQLASPSKVLSFLSLPNWDSWDPSLAMVMLFGVLPSLLEIQVRGFSTPPLFKSKFDLPSKTFKDTDWLFVLGAAVFGIGWGLTGACPGPAVLRAAAQPTWGLLWMGGFWLGGKLAPP
ncbi:YeeE/YedE family integral membrane protein-like protein [Polyplosphaeria fusca]|uniref:YeeE/YedE family integral membrane protein-like protein n=1 Tax=Polyplosphaeria fusca TaxID=682080 RepID=A0A9P4R3P3_9PLEO|nr:YeeE/YedE family integral membrane protein-like protein [Polyplosphaeria fusca]